MFPQLAEELERMIWQSFWSRFVLKEIMSYEPIWINPSNVLVCNSHDLGALQHGYSDLDRTLFHKDCIWPHLREEIYEKCFLNVCNNCVIKGFPCRDAILCGGMNIKIQELWDLTFYKKLVNEHEAFYLGIEYI
jgi:hypothetical protein